ncbi:MAG: FkbM family methyltransferase [Oscillospiraceae bacterium]
MLPFSIPSTGLWDRLQTAEKPIVLYGMGDGAEKILRVCAEKGVSVADIFASDEYVRGHSFAGFRVKKLVEIEALYQDFIILIAFAATTTRCCSVSARSTRNTKSMRPTCRSLAAGCSHTPIYRPVNRTTRRHTACWRTKPPPGVCGYSALQTHGEMRYLRRCETPKQEAYTGILKPSPHERYLDLGAYNGDTIRELLSFTGGRAERIWAMEPDPKTFRKLSAYLETLSIPATAVCKGVWDSECTLRFGGKAGRGSVLDEAGRLVVPVLPVDSLLNGEAVTLLKMDVEGAEREALAGAARTIGACKPKLIVSAYHRTGDLADLALQIHALRPDYRIHLRHHPYVPAWETNYYCI